VLVPEPGHRVLVSAVRSRGRRRVLYVLRSGHSSGCIAIAIAHYAPEVEVVASDISREALEVAERNVAKHG